MQPDYDPAEGRILMTIRMKEWKWKRHQGQWRSWGWKARHIMMMDNMALIVVMGYHLNFQ